MTNNSELKESNPKSAFGDVKIPLHLWPGTATILGSLGLLDGALKYGRGNWKAVGVRASTYYDACGRHLNKWFEGEESDPDSGLPHLAHALACLAIIVDAEAAGKLEDDRNYKGGYVDMIGRLTPHVARLKALHAAKNPRHYTIKDNTKEDKCEGHECWERALTADDDSLKGQEPWYTDHCREIEMAHAASIVGRSTGPGPGHTGGSDRAESIAPPAGSGSHRATMEEPGVPSAPRSIGTRGRTIDDETCGADAAIPAGDPQFPGDSVASDAPRPSASGTSPSGESESRKEGAYIVGGQSRNSWRYQKPLKR